MKFSVGYIQAELLSVWSLMQNPWNVLSEKMLTSSPKWRISGTGT